MSSKYQIIPFYVKSLYVSADKELEIKKQNTDYSWLPYYNEQGAQNQKTPFIGLTSSSSYQIMQDLPKGIHLHFMMPQILKQSFPDTEEHPPTPNRWLVVRNRNGVSKTWLLLSDYMDEKPSTNHLQTNVILPVSSTDTDSKNERKQGEVFIKGTYKTKQPFRYVGQVKSISSLSDLPQAGTISESYNKWTFYFDEPLSVMGTGQLDFASFYPNAASVFGFHDAEGLPNDDYTIYGWWQDLFSPEWDELKWKRFSQYLLSNPSSTGLENSIEDLTEGNDIQKNILKATKEGVQNKLTFPHILKYDGKWFKEQKNKHKVKGFTELPSMPILGKQLKEQLANDKEKYTVTIANTSIEAISAFIADTISTGNTYDVDADIKELRQELKTLKVLKVLEDNFTDTGEDIQTWQALKQLNGLSNLDISEIKSIKRLADLPSDDARAKALVEESKALDFLSSYNQLAGINNQQRLIRLIKDGIAPAKLKVREEQQLDVLIASIEQLNNKDKNKLKKVVIEDLLEAVQMEFFKDKKLDIGAKFVEARHRKGFISKRGQRNYQLTYKFLNAQKESNKTANQNSNTTDRVYNILKKDYIINNYFYTLSVELNSLNALKQQYNHNLDLCEQKQKDIFYTWLKYQMLRYGNKTNASSMLKDFATGIHMEAWAKHKQRPQDAEILNVMIYQMAKLFKLQKDTFPSFQRFNQIRDLYKNDAQPYIRTIAKHLDKIQSFTPINYQLEKTLEYLTNLVGIPKKDKVVLQRSSGKAFLKTQKNTLEDWNKLDGNHLLTLKRNTELAIQAINKSAQTVDTNVKDINTDLSIYLPNEQLNSFKTTVNDFVPKLNEVINEIERLQLSIENLFSSYSSKDSVEEVLKALDTSIKEVRKTYSLLAVSKANKLYFKDLEQYFENIEDELTQKYNTITTDAINKLLDKVEVLINESQAYSERVNIELKNLTIFYNKISSKIDDENIELENLILDILQLEVYLFNILRRVEGTTEDKQLKEAIDKINSNEFSTFINSLELYHNVEDAISDFKTIYHLPAKQFLNDIENVSKYLGKLLHVYNDFKYIAKHAKNHAKLIHQEVIFSSVLSEPKQLNDRKLAEELRNNYILPIPQSLMREMVYTIEHLDESSTVPVGNSEQIKTQLGHWYSEHQKGNNELHNENLFNEFFKLALANFNINNDSSEYKVNQELGVAINSWVNSSTEDVKIWNQKIKNYTQDDKDVDSYFFIPQLLKQAIIEILGKNPAQLSKSPASNEQDIQTFINDYKAKLLVIKNLVGDSSIGSKVTSLVAKGNYELFDALDEYYKVLKDHNKNIKQFRQDFEYLLQKQLTTELDSRNKFIQHLKDFTQKEVYSPSILEQLVNQQIKIEKLLTKLNQEIEKRCYDDRKENAAEVILKDYPIAVVKKDQLTFSIEETIGTRYYQPSNPVILFQRNNTTKTASDKDYQPTILYWKAHFNSISRPFTNQKENESYPKENLDDSIDYPKDVVAKYFDTPTNQPDFKWNNSLIQDTQSSGFNFNQYVGLSLLTDYAKTSFLDSLIGAINKSEDSVVVDILEQAKSIAEASDFYMQQLNGFNDAFMTLHPLEQLPVYDPQDNGIYANIIRAAGYSIGNIRTISPLTFSAFNPLRSGAFNIAEVNFFDSFGQHQQLLNKTAIAEHRKKVIVSSTLQPSIHFSNSSIADYDAFFTPRLIQFTKLKARWVAGQNETNKDTETNTIHHSSPICGWIVPNNLSKSLMIYDAEGVELGSLIQKGGNKVVFLSSYKDLYADIEDIPNKHLRNFVEYIQRDRDNSALLNIFIQLIDESLHYIDPDSYSLHPELSIFAGRPIALARIKLGFEIEGIPSYSHRAGDSTFILDENKNDDGIYPLPNTERYFVKKNNRGIDNIDIPIRLGDYQQLNDGLIGYWYNNEKNYHREPSSSIDIENDYFFAPITKNNFTHKKIISSTYQNSHLVQISQSIKEKPLYINMLFDPRAKLNITTGILPVKTIDIPSKLYYDALRKLEITFLNAPIITPRDKFRLPIMEDEAIQWHWKYYEENDSNQIIINRKRFQQALNALKVQGDESNIWNTLINNEIIKEQDGKYYYQYHQSDIQSKWQKVNQHEILKWILDTYFNKDILTLTQDAIIYKSSVENSLKSLKLEEFDAEKVWQTLEKYQWIATLKDYQIQPSKLDKAMDDLNKSKSSPLKDLNTKHLKEVLSRYTPDNLGTHISKSQLQKDFEVFGYYQLAQSTKEIWEFMTNKEYIELSALSRAKKLASPVSFSGGKTADNINLPALPIKWIEEEGTFKWILDTYARGIATELGHPEYKYQEIREGWLKINSKVLTEI